MDASSPATSIREAVLSQMHVRSVGQMHRRHSTAEAGSDHDWLADVFIGADMQLGLLDCVAKARERLVAGRPSSQW
jgi:hypothetical protein